MNQKVENISPSILKMLIEESLSHIETTEAEQSFATLFSELISKKILNKEYLDQVLALAKQDKKTVPREYLVQCQQFQMLFSPELVSNSHDRALVEASFSALNLSVYPDPIAFIQSELLANEALSDETKIKLIEAFGLAKPVISSGTDISRNLMEQTLNP